MIQMMGLDLHRKKIQLKKIIITCKVVRPQKLPWHNI